MARGCKRISSCGPPAPGGCSRRSTCRRTTRDSHAPTLQTVADAPIFAVGDCGTIEVRRHQKPAYTPYSKSFSWRISGILDVRPLKPYVPQKRFLKLLNTGDGRAIAEYWGLAFQGRWCWKLKDYIDSRFMDMYQDYRPMPMTTPAADSAAEQMRCLGCGGKVSGSVLSKVLSRLDIPPNEHVVVGLDAPDDAAVIRMPEGRPMTVTVDFFTAPFDDPYLVGRIAALNSASDIFAMGAHPRAALALATIPVGRPRQQEQLLYELLAGSMEEFRRMQTTLVGGHTIEGPQLTIGFTVLADQGNGPLGPRAVCEPAIA